MNRRESVLSMLALGAGGSPLAAFAQPKEKAWRVGIFMSRSGGGMAEQAFLAGMKEYGYVVGKNLIIEARHAEGDPARYPAIADELIALKPDVLLVSSTGNALVVKGRTTTIPVVMGSVGDPVGDGLVQSLARPGGNITGNSLQLTELSAKQIEVAGEMLPRMRRVALLIDSSQPEANGVRQVRLANTAAAARSLSLEVFRADGAAEIREAIRKVEGRKTDALLIGAAPSINELRREICRNAANSRLPIVGFSDEWAHDGALLSFGPSWQEAYRRAAYFVDRILKGAKPADLPVEQPTKFSLVINAKTARLFGVKIPQSILVRADRVVE